MRQRAQPLRPQVCAGLYLPLIKTGDLFYTGLYSLATQNCKQCKTSKINLAFRKIYFRLKLTLYKMNLLSLLSAATANPKMVYFNSFGKSMENICV